LPHRVHRIRAFFVDTPRPAGEADAADRAQLAAFVRDAPVEGRVRHPHVQELLGHANVETTMIYTHVLNGGGRGVKSPLDGLD
jgi:integrase